MLLGLVFMVIVYFLPRGVTGLLEDAWERVRNAWPAVIDRVRDRLLRRLPSGGR